MDVLSVDKTLFKRRWQRDPFDPGRINQGDLLQLVLFSTCLYRSHACYSFYRSDQ